MWRKGNPHSLQTGAAAREIAVRNIPNITINISSDPTIPLLARAHNSESYSTDTCSVILIARKSKQSKCSSTNERIMKMGYIYNIEYYSAVKKYEITKFSGNQMKFIKRSY